MKRLSVLFLVVLCFFAVSTGTLFASGGQEEESTAAAAGGAGYSLPIVEPGSVTLKVAGWDLNEPSLKENPGIWQYIEEDTGVKIDWQVVPRNDYPTFMQTRIAAAQDLPDIMSFGWMHNVGNPVDLYAKGAVLQLTDLVEQYAPNIKALMERFPALRPYLVAPDGEIYATAGRTVPPLTNFKDLYIRKDWLDKLGLERPETLDDWKVVLKAFKTQDPNGNGEADEIPLAGASQWWYEWFASSALDLDVWYNYGFRLENGVISYDYISPGYRDYLEFMNELYEEGLIPPEVAMGNPPRNSLISEGKVGAAFTGLGGWQFFDRLLSNGGVDGEYTWTMPPQAKDGSVRYVHEPLVIARSGITTQSENPEVAIKWLDYVWASPEGYLYSNYGLEGETYELVPGKAESVWLQGFDGGRPQYLDKALFNAENKSIQTLLGEIGAFNHFLYADDDISFSERYIPQPKYKEGTTLARPIAETPFPAYLATSEQERRLRALREEINPYRDEWTFKFITGQEPLSDYDKYVATMKRIGVDELVKITQEQHDAYQASVGK